MSNIVREERGGEQNRLTEHLASRSKVSADGVGFDVVVDIFRIAILGFRLKLVARYRP